MIKATTKDSNGNPVLILGLSKMNMQKLKEDMPIAFDTSAVGLPQMKVIIMYGKTEADMAKMFKENFHIKNFVDQTTPKHGDN